MKINELMDGRMYEWRFWLAMDFLLVKRVAVLMDAGVGLNPTPMSDIVFS
jgi:hypothetical protein